MATTDNALEPPLTGKQLRQQEYINMLINKSKLREAMKAKADKEVQVELDLGSDISYTGYKADKITVDELGLDKPLSTEEILIQRGQQYGDFRSHAEITQNLLHISRLFVADKRGAVIHELLDATQLEALQMIFHKIGRILNGNPNYADSWDDIAGYARLVGDDIRRKENETD